MRELLAKIILGEDIHQELEHAEQNYTRQETKVQNVDSEIERLRQELADLKKLAETSEDDFPQIESALISLGVVNDGGENAVQKILNGKTERITALKTELQTKEAEKAEVAAKLNKAEKEKEDLNIANKSLSDELGKLEKEIKESRKNQEQTKEKLAQAEKIRDNIKNIKDSWESDLQKFRVKMESLDRKSLEELKKELISFEAKIRRHVETT